jgi:hypothetical protein
MSDETESYSGKKYLEIVKQMVDEVKYGYITITVQDGRVIQIDQNKKIRIKN